MGLSGVGTDVAGQLLVTAGDNPQRLRSEAAFAMLCGAAPLPASSGRTHRHRLNRGGDRQANAALYRVVLCRLRWDPRTRAYAAIAEIHQQVAGLLGNPGARGVGSDPCDVHAAGVLDHDEDVEAA
jgi:transposase